MAVVRRLPMNAGTRQRVFVDAGAEGATAAPAAAPSRPQQKPRHRPQKEGRPAVDRAVVCGPGAVHP